MNKVLIIGNDPTVDQIDFVRLNPNLITVGTNRAWLKLIPNYFFFHDPKIFQELESFPKKLEDLKFHSNVISSDWLAIQCSKLKIERPDWVKYYRRPDRYKYVDCVTTAIDILNRHVFNKRDTTYYVAGVSLRWQNPSHFWKKNPIDGIGNKNDQAWYNPRFDRTYKNFKTLKDSNTKIISVTPDSKINKLFRYENVANLYS